MFCRYRWIILSILNYYYKKLVLSCDKLSYALKKKMHYRQWNFFIIDLESHEFVHFRIFDQSAVGFSVLLKRLYHLVYIKLKKILSPLHNNTIKTISSTAKILRLKFYQLYFFNDTEYDTYIFNNLIRTLDFAVLLNVFIVLCCGGD